MYSGVLYLKHPEVMTYKFDESLVQRYLCSQDIPREPPCKRLFLSDGEIHIAAGYLYATGNEPTSYNFQHPPLIKYLYGYSILFFGNPFLVQVVLGIALLLATYALSYRIFLSAEVSLVTGLFLVLDPLFLHVSTNTLLDLGQAVLVMTYMLLMLFHRRKVLMQGIVLGLLCGTKFWGGSLFFILIVPFYLQWRRQLDMRGYIKHVVIAVVTFVLIYSATFVDRGGQFNLLFFQLKTFNYWIHHSVSSTFGASLLLFTTGYVKTWWGTQDLSWSDTWSVLWPVILSLSIFRSGYLWVKKVFTVEILIAVMPVAYLVYLGVQAPFTRYFIIILPFLYMTLSWQITRMFVALGEKKS